MEYETAPFNPFGFSTILYLVEATKELPDEVYNFLELLKRVITGDDTWFYEFELETKVQLS